MAYHIVRARNLFLGIVVLCLFTSSLGIEFLGASLNDRECAELKKRIPNLNCDLLKIEGERRLKLITLKGFEDISRKTSTHDATIDQSNEEEILLSTKTIEDISLKFQVSQNHSKPMRSEEFLVKLKNLSKLE